MVSLVDLLRPTAGDGPLADGRTIDAQAAVLALRQAAQRYAAPMPFAVGDLVTPRSDANLQRHGEPHIVVEIIDPPIRSDAVSLESIGSNRAYCRFDLRVMVCDGGGTVHPFLAESWRFDRYEAAE